MPSGKERYVVAHTKVDDWDQGHVLTREQLGDRHDRLLSLGAIRAATEAEAALPRVDVVAGRTLSGAALLTLAEKDAEIQRLERYAGSLTDKLASYATATVPNEATVDDPHVRRLYAEKDERLAVVKRQCEGLEASVKAAEDAARKENAPKPAPDAPRSTAVHVEAGKVVPHEPEPAAGKKGK